MINNIWSRKRQQGDTTITTTVLVDEEGGTAISESFERPTGGGSYTVVLSRQEWEEINQKVVEHTQLITNGVASTPDNVEWPRCKCGHLAQDHNRGLGQEPENYGCDICNISPSYCNAYRFPDSTPQAVRDVLNARRERIYREHSPKVVS